MKSENLQTIPVIKRETSNYEFVIDELKKKTNELQSMIEIHNNKIAVLSNDLDALKSKRENSFENCDTPTNQSINRSDSVSTAELQRNATTLIDKIDPNLGLYEIYIGKFQMNVYKDQIMRHIIQSADIYNSELFHIQKLGGSRYCHTFASFKITTMKYDICMKIMNLDWGPQRARIFTRIPPKQMGSNNIYRRNFKVRSYSNHRTYNSTYEHDFSPSNCYRNHANGYKNGNFHRSDERMGNYLLENA